MTQTITIKELLENAGKLLTSLGESDEIIVSDGNKPVAKISAPPPPSPADPLDLSFDPSKPREFGFWAGKVWVAPDFDDPLPDSFWLGEDQ